MAVTQTLLISFTTQEERKLKNHNSMPQEKTILLIDDSHKILIERLKDKGYIVDYRPNYTREDILANISCYDCLIVRSKIKIDKQIIDKGVNLKCIARSGAGMDSIDVDYAQKKNILCLNSPEGNRDAVGEHAVGLLLSLFNKINFADKEVRQGLWRREENRGVEIKGKTIGIIGYGNMGKAFSQRLQGFDCKVIAYDKYKKGFSNSFCQEVSLDDIFCESDVLSFHVPLTKETEYMFCDEFVSCFKKSFYLINTSRGKVVKLSSLIKAMKDDKVKGAGLDVLEYENFSNQMTDDNKANEELNTLFAMSNTVFTPHVAGWTKESYYKLALFLSDKIIDVLG